MQLITISGNLGRDAELRSTNSGDQICSFSVGVKQGWGDKASSNWFRCNLWGKRAESINGKLTKGLKVVVVGELTIGEYQGKPQYDVRVSEVEFTAAAAKASGWGDDGQSSGVNAKPGDLDDDVPF